jgi:hypothetical protein
MRRSEPSAVKSKRNASASWIVIFAGSCEERSRPAMSRSISTTWRWSRRSINGNVIAPRPGPISTTRSSVRGGDGIDDLPDGRRVDQEVLTEALARQVFRRLHACSPATGV